MSAQDRRTCTRQHADDSKRRRSDLWRQRTGDRRPVRSIEQHLSVIRPSSRPLILFDSTATEAEFHRLSHVQGVDLLTDRPQRDVLAHCVDQNGVASSSRRQPLARDGKSLRDTVSHFEIQSVEHVYECRPSQRNGLLEYAVAEQFIESALGDDLHSAAEELFQVGDQSAGEPGAWLGADFN